MSYYFLYIEVTFRPEVIERILRVIRHRGFVLCSLNMFPCGKGYYSDRNKFHIYVTIVSNRSINILCEHLNKLIDVSDVILQDIN